MVHENLTFWSLYAYWVHDGCACDDSVHRLTFEGTHVGKTERVSGAKISVMMIHTVSAFHLSLQLHLYTYLSQLLLTQRADVYTCCLICFTTRREREYRSTGECHLINSFSPLVLFVIFQNSLSVFVFITKKCYHLCVCVSLTHDDIRYTRTGRYDRGNGNFRFTIRDTQGIWGHQMKRQRKTHTHR